MRIAIVSGSWPPDRCGVGDYSHELAKAIEIRGSNVVRIGGEPWSGIAAIRQLKIEIDSGKLDVVLLQYPTMGYARSLIPALIAALCKIPVIVTIHEFSSFNVCRRPWFFTFARCVDARIFTNEKERLIFQRCMKPQCGHDIVVDIGSNIPKVAGYKRIPKTICYFGLICPGKGLEEFLRLVPKARAAGWRISIIGAIPNGSADYASGILTEARSFEVGIHLDYSALRVGQMLAQTEIAYLPFPHGATAARGSLLAAMINGAVVVTRHGTDTPETLKCATVHAFDEDDAFKKIGDLFADEHQRENLREISYEIPRDWKDIAASHIAVFNLVLGQRQSQNPMPDGPRQCLPH